MFRHRTSWALVALVGLVGCSEDQTAILLELESPNLVVPTDIAQVRILAVGESGVMADVTNDLPGTWPQSFAIRPGAGGTEELVSIRVYGLAGGRERIRRVLAPVRFVSGRTTRVSVILDRDCLDVMCTSPDVGCLAGMCTGEMPMDGGVDAGTDAGMSDAGDLDGGEDAGEVDAGVDAGTDAGTDAGMSGMGQLLFTEYVEGSSNNKAIELTNIGDGVMSLVGCELRLYSNGSATPGNTLTLTGELAAGASNVYCQPGYVGAGSCVATSLAVNFNGDDAFALVCMGAMIDVIGQIGIDPGTEWSGGGLSTANRTLRRKCEITMGDTNGSDAFDPSIEWDGFPEDTFDDLGMRVCP